jgi:N-acetylglutamate synthase-like GNAT family acetyltransferase
MVDLAANSVIRAARLTDLEWVNARYDEVKFKRSNYEKEYIAIAELNNKRAGLGRLVRVDSKSAELGGIYVLPDYRGSGIASKIVEFLLLYSTSYEQIFCLPFAHLERFYGKYGFVTVDAAEIVPAEILEKHRWCQNTYEPETLLLVKRRYA